MGGNVKVIDRQSGELKQIEGKTIGADKIDFSKISREEFRKSFLDFLFELQDKFFEIFNDFLWYDLEKLIQSDKLFNGSSRFGFDLSISDEEFNQYKKTMGDIDLVIPKEKLKDLFTLLSQIEGKNITSDIKYIGQNKKEQFGEQINALFSFKDKINFQVDFEGVIFKDSLPDDFSNFGHSSCWEDIKLGLKGVAHKYLIMNLVRAMTLVPSDKGKLLTLKSSIDPNDKNFKLSKSSKYLKTHAFSINKGLRKKLKEVGELNDVPLFKEIPTSESYYERDIKRIFKIIFNKEPSEEDLKDFYSFSGCVNLIKKYIDDNEVLSIMIQFLIKENLFGDLAQRLDRYSMKEDFKIKSRMLEILLKKFPSLFSKNIKELILQMVEEYYQPEKYFKERKEKMINKIKTNSEVKMTQEEAIRRIIKEEIAKLMHEDSRLQKSLKKLLAIIKETVGKSFEKQVKRTYISSDQSKWVEIELKSVNQTLSLNLLKDEISYGSNKIENLFKIKNTTPTKSWEEYSGKLNDFSNEISEIVKLYSKLKKSKKIKDFIAKEL